MASALQCVASRPRPVNEIRLRHISGAIWKNETHYGTRYSVTIQREYHVGNQRKFSKSFGCGDLRLVAKVAEQARLWISEQGGDASRRRRAERFYD